MCVSPIHELPGQPNASEPHLPAQGNLNGRKVTRYYPEIGESLPKTKEKWISTLKKIAIAVFIIMASAAIGFLAGGPIGAAIGAGVGAGIVLSLALVKIIHDLVSTKRLLYQLPQEGNHKALLPQNIAKLGKYTDVNLRLTENADESRDWKLKMIDAAEESIEFSCNFAGGELFRDALSRIETKLKNKADFRAHLILSHDDILESQDKEILKRLSETYPGKFEYLISDRHRKLGLSIHTEENHIKMLVIDGKYFVSGGTGMAPQFCRDNHVPAPGEKTSGLIPPAAKDTDLVGESTKLAELMRDQFFNLYRMWEIRTNGKEVPSRYFQLTKAKGICEDFHKNDGLFPNVRVKYMVSGPEHGTQNPIVREYVKRIERSTEKIRLAHWKFNPTSPIKDALQKAKAAHPDMKITAQLNGMSDSFSLGRYYLTHSNRAFYYLVDKVYEYTGAHQLYHKKVALFDKSHLMIGSFNFNKKSAKYDHEAMFVVKSKDLIAACQKSLKEDKARSVKVNSSHSICSNIFAKIYSNLLARVTQNEV